MPEKTSKGPSLQLVAIVSFVATYVLWILSLPCFPTSDGPVHMYYVHVLQALLLHSNAQYLHFFRIRHILPPYSLYYYALLAGSKWMPMLLVDRLIICCYFVSFTFGFRYLARAIGPSADLITLLATVLLLNWPLGMGFVNFCLSLSFSFWATGLWLRFQGKRDFQRRVVFLLLVTAIMLTHPVPLLLLLGVTSMAFLVRILQASHGARGFQLPAHGKADLLTLAIASLNLGYVKLFALANPFKQTKDAQPVAYWAETLRRISIYSREHALNFVMGRSLDIYVYRAALFLILVAGIGLAVRQRLRNRSANTWTVGDTFLLLGGLLFFILPFIPSQLNGLYYFADRLVMCVWLAFLLAASGWSMRTGGTVPSPYLRTEGAPATLFLGRRGPLSVRAVGLAFILFSAGTHVALLTASDRLLRPAAKAIESLDHGEIVPFGQIGFVLDDQRMPLGLSKQGVSWNPYYWATLHLFRHNDAVLANAPWMHETILPVAPSDALPEVTLAALQEPFPSELAKDLLASPQQLREVLAVSTFFVVNQLDRPGPEGNEPLLRSSAAAAQHWSCTDRIWYRICTRSVEALHN